MSFTKAVLILDPDRRPEQLAYVSERTRVLYEAGDQLWVSISEEQVERFSDQGIVVQVHEEADRIELPAIVFDPSRGAPDPPIGLTASPPVSNEKAYYLVQFIGPADFEWIEEIGDDYVQGVPVNAGIAHLTAGQAYQVEQLEYVSWVGLFHPAYALSYVLAGRHEPFSATSLREMSVNAEMLPGTAGGNLQVRFLDDVDLAAARSDLSGTGVTITSDTELGFIVQAEAAAIPDLLKVPGVLSVEGYYAPRLSNNRAGVIMGTDQVRSVGNVDFLVNLDGTGEIVGVIDSGLDSGTLTPPPGTPPIHADILPRVLQITNLAAPGIPVPDTAPHGTHVTGSIAGNGAGSGGQIRGIAPASHVVFNGPLGGNLIQGLRNAHNAGARVHNNSWGTSFTATCGPLPNPLNYIFPSNNPYSAGNTDIIDRFCYIHPESLVLFAAGNDERDVQPVATDGMADANMLTFEACAKNVLTVGASENLQNNEGYPNDYRNFFTPPAPIAGCLPPDPARYSNANWTPWNAPGAGPAGGFYMSDNANHLALFSARGRVNLSGAGRVRPDLVAPGTNILSLRSSQQAPPPVGALPAHPTLVSWWVSRTQPRALYELMHGTSMATPQVTGAAALARQYYRGRFGQLRRPRLLEFVNAIVDLPSIAPHGDGCVMAWIRQDAAGLNHIVAGKYSRGLTRTGNIVPLQANVGANPAPALCRHGDNTLLLHRAGDGTVRLSLYDQNLAAVHAFGTAGTVTLAPGSRPEDSRPPAFCVQGDEIAVVWNEAGGDNLRFQRFRADNGTPVDASAQDLGSMTHTSPHPYMVHNGSHYAVVWVYLDGTDRKLQLRFVDNSGTPTEAQPITLATQAEDIRDPHIVWDSRRNRFLVVWAGSNTHAGGDIYYLFLRANGSRIGGPAPVFIVPPADTVRRPYIALHPESGYTLLWEDNTQTNAHDVYLTFLDDNGQPDRVPVDPADPPVPPSPPNPGRLSRQLLRISDTPTNTSGFSALSDGDGVAIAWQSNDEINSDRRGVYTLNMTPQGAFQSQSDPRTPAINSGKYVNHQLTRHGFRTLTSVSMAWAGGTYFLLRGGAGEFLGELQLVKTNADGLADPGYGGNGVRGLPAGFEFKQHELHWTGSRLVAVTVGFLSNPRVYLFDADGTPVPGFGAGGTRVIEDDNLMNTDISPQLGHYTRPAFRAVVVYGTGLLQANTIRYAVLDSSGNYVTAPRDMATASGTARHGWFHFVNGEGASIAAWHREVAPGGGMAVYVNRFTPSGGRRGGAAEVQLTTLAGDSRNASIALRPVAINSRRREYGIVWQYRASDAARWQVRFSRLDRNRTPAGQPPAPAPPVAGGTRDVRVIYPGAPGWTAGLHATEPQIVSTYQHEPWANPPSPLPAGTSLPDWSPSYGLAWLGQAAIGGNRSLHFTTLDENGSRPLFPLPPPYAPGAARNAIAPILQVSRAGVDVTEFKLVWNGRTFRLTWVEVENGQVRHMQTALTRQGSRAVYDQPSSALLRATLINGATNITNTSLPNIPVPPITPANRNDGYGWGRVNLRQSLSPSPPVTFHVRDDNSVGPGRTAGYRFHLPAATQLLRTTLCWTDPEGARLVNRLHLRLRDPAGNVYYGNTWQAAPNAHLSRVVAAGDGFQTIHNTEQIVLQAPPAGDYDVDVIAEIIPHTNAYNQLGAQAFALVFVGSGPEVRFPGLPAPIPVY